MSPKDSNGWPALGLLCQPLRAPQKHPGLWICWTHALYMGYGKIKWSLYIRPTVSDGRQTVVWLTPKHQWQLPARDGSCTLFLMIPKSLRNLRWQCMKTYITAKHVDHDTCHAGAATFPKSNVTCSSAVPGEAKVFNLLGLSVKAGVWGIGRRNRQSKAQSHTQDP